MWLGTPDIDNLLTTTRPQNITLYILHLCQYGRQTKRYGREREKGQGFSVCSTCHSSYHFQHSRDPESDLLRTRLTNSCTLRTSRLRAYHKAVQINYTYQSRQKAPVSSLNPRKVEKLKQVLSKHCIILLWQNIEILSCLKHCLAAAHMLQCIA